MKNLAASYQMGMELLSKKMSVNSQVAHGELADELRYQGQEMTKLSEELVSFEHNQIRIILDELVRRLIVWSLVAITVGIFMPLIMTFRIFEPLRIIKEATEDIAQGRFSKIEVLDTRDEMQQVMEAFNIMVKELERRQDQLVQSQKLSSIGTLTAGIAHQLNNPLNNISTSCQIAVDDFDADDPELIKQMLRNIEQETYRARDVVQGLLEFSRSKEFQLHLANLQNVVNRSVQLVKSQVPSAISILVDVPENLFLPMDVQRIQEVLIIMIINASQAIVDEGKISLSASLDTTGNDAVIEITDTGTGIPDAIKDRLFDPFYTTKEEGQGTGLGLSIAYGIIQKHNGRIVVESVAGNGASFFIYLPLRQEQVAEQGDLS
jgi:two-component system, NtrC family, sensor kinase